MESKFYQQITPVKEDYIDSDGSPASMDLPLVTLPAGTILFRGLKISKGDDVRSFYRDFLGNPEGRDSICLSPSHNVFFYPFPYVAFGANEVGKTFDMMQMFVLVHPVTIVCAISPSTWVRGMGQRFSGSAPFQRCSTMVLNCHPPSPQELIQMSYDNCLLPEYQIRSGTRGWMSLADLDSFYPKGFTKQKKTSKNSSMGSFIRSLETRQPGKGIELLAFSYTDDAKHAGFPEIVLYPYKKHQGTRLLTRSCPNETIALKLMEREAKADNFNFLPIAAFTKDGAVDMINGFFSYESLGLSENSFAAPPANSQAGIETHIRGFMDKAQSEGIELPFYGNGKLSFDTRTGFYVLPQVLSKIQVTSKGVEPESVGGGGSSAQQSISYRNLIIPLDTEEARKNAIVYMLKFRTVLPEKYMEKYGIAKGFGLRRAMVFNRPPVLASVFKGLELELPREYRGALAQAAALYQKESGVLPKAALAAAAAGVGGAAPGTPPYYPQSTTPQFGAQGSRTPQFGAQGPGTPKFGPGTPQFGPGTPQFGPGTPQFGAEGSRTPQFGAEGGAAPSSPPYVPEPYEEGSGTPAYAPETPEEGPRSPAYAPGSPVYAPGSGEQGNQSPAYKNTTPEPPQGGAGPPQGGAAAKTVGTNPPKLQIGGKRNTRKRRENSMLDYAMNFKGIWHAHARSK
jgi:hypothetical protein